MAKITMDYQGRMTIGGKVFTFLAGKEFDVSEKELKVFEAEKARRGKLAGNKRAIEAKKKQEKADRG